MQSGSGGAGAVGGWEADLGGMGSAFGGMQLSNSAGIVRPPSHAQRRFPAGPDVHILPLKSRRIKQRHHYWGSGSGIHLV